MNDITHIALAYPRDSNIKRIQIGLLDVRAADDIQIEYDYDRDGWIIKQDEYESRDGIIYAVLDWKEVAFIPAWSRLIKDE